MAATYQIRSSNTQSRFTYYFKDIICFRVSYLWSLSKFSVSIDAVVRITWRVSRIV